MRTAAKLGAASVVVATSALVAGCTVVFGISRGELDPDPFGRDAGLTADADDATTDLPALDSGEAGAPPGAADAAADGATAPDSGPPPCNPLLLDNLEDGDAAIARCSGRNGVWYTYNDGSTTGRQAPLPGRPFAPVAPGRGTSKYAASVSGSGFTTRGAGMGFDLRYVTAGTKATYDASAYSGVTFWAKAKAATKIYVNVPNRDTDGIGGVCTGTGCNDHYGKGLDITTAWAQYTVKFADMSPDGWGVPKPAGFDRARIYSIEFHTSKNTVFEMWVDDIAFVP